MAHKNISHPNCQSAARLLEPYLNGSEGNRILLNDAASIIRHLGTCAPEWLNGKGGCLLMQPPFSSLVNFFVYLELSCISLRFSCETQNAKITCVLGRSC